MMSKWKLILICLPWLALGYVFLNMQGSGDAGKIAALIGHKSPDISETMALVGGKPGGEYSSAEKLYKDMAWFSPQPHIPFKHKVLYYRTGGCFGSGSAWIFLDKDDVVYAVHFAEDAVLLKTHGSK